MLKKLVLNLIGSNAGLYLAVRFVSQVDFEGSLGLFVLAGSVLGILNFILKPLINLVAFPVLTFLTFGLFNLIINSAIVWGVDILFPELKIIGIGPLVITSLIVSLVSFLVNVVMK